MNKKKGFTLTEILIAAGILSAFVGGVLTLYSSGSKMGNSTLWLQNAASMLKNTARQINASIRKSSYPSCLTFPQGIRESEQDCFKIHYFNGTLKVADSGEKSSTFYGKPFLQLTESQPAKSGYSPEENRKAVLIYHTFALAKNGDLTYCRFKEEVEGSIISSDYTVAIPGAAEGVYMSVLAKDVESVTCEKTDASGKDDPLQVKITSVMPRNGTSRSEVAVGTPNVEVIGDLK